MIYHPISGQRSDQVFARVDCQLLNSQQPGYLYVLCSAVQFGRSGNGCLSTLDDGGNGNSINVAQ